LLVYPLGFPSRRVLCQPSLLSLRLMRMPSLTGKWKEICRVGQSSLEWGCMTRQHCWRPLESVNLLVDNLNDGTTA
jgi:hypothetical protein